MGLEKLKNINDAPCAGHVLAYFRRAGILFEKYDTLEGVLAKIDATILEKDDTLLELHLFDAEKEYRCIKTEAKSRLEDYIEYLAGFKEEAASVYAEEVELEKHMPGQLVVLNHITYQEDNGMAVVDDYRLQMKGV